MGFITIRKRNAAVGHLERQGITVLDDGPAPRESIGRRIGSFLDASAKVIGSGVRHTKEELTTVKQSEAFKQGTTWLHQTNEHYQAAFNSDTNHLARAGRRR